MILKLKKNFQKYISKKSDFETFQNIMSIQGDIYRKVEQRETLKFSIQKKDYFIKKHFGVTWKVIFESLLRFRLPIISAQNEYNAIQHLAALKIGVPAIVGYGKKGYLPTKTQSFIITKSLEPKQQIHELIQKWLETPPEFHLKNWLILEMANLIKRMHESGLNHRDCYLVHFLINAKIKTHLPKKKPTIYVLDLHRSQIRKKTPTRWKIKDLAGLYFSSKHANLTSRDFYRFIKHYRGKSLKEILKTEKNFWKRVQTKGEKLFQKEKKRKNNLKKMFKNASQFIKKKNWRYSMIYDKNFAPIIKRIFNKKSSSNVVKNPISLLDKIIANGVMLKDGIKCTVAKTTIDNTTFVIKRHNVTSLWMMLRRALQKKSRAQKNWENAHRLLLNNFLTPRPIAMIEERFGPFRKKSYFIMQYISGEILNLKKKPIQFDQLKKLIQSLHQHHMTHGDTKETNFIKNNNNIYILDLDAMKKHKIHNKRFIHCVKKDLKRLYKNVETS